MKRKHMNRKGIVLKELLIFIAVGFIAFIIGKGLVNFNLWPKAKSIPANITVNLSIVGAEVDTEFYHAFAQGGEEPRDMLSPVLSEIRALKPKLIRLDHIYDYYSVVSRTNGSLTFDFSKLDAAVDTIRATGAVPMLSLSYMPAAIAYEGNILNSPNNWFEWSLVVQKTVEHYSGFRNKNISGMYYEVWNEPDLPQFGDWDYRGGKNYITLYRYASIGAQKARLIGTNPFSLGGPATTAYYPNWAKAMIDAGGFDFLSWHSYSRNPETIQKNISDLRFLLSSYPQYANLPLIISEFGFTGAHDVGYSTSYAASHVAAVVRKLIDKPPRFLVSFELKDGPKEANDGWGLLRHELFGKASKPRYSVYNFLDMMNGRRVSLSGEGSRVTGWAIAEEGITKVLLVNFDEEMPLSETVPVTFTEISPGSYRLRQKYFLGVDGTQTIEASQSSFTKHIYVPASSMVFLSIEKITP